MPDKNGMAASAIGKVTELDVYNEAFSGSGHGHSSILRCVLCKNTAQPFEFYVTRACELSYTYRTHDRALNASKLPEKKNVSHLFFPLERYS